MSKYQDSKNDITNSATVIVNTQDLEEKLRQARDAAKEDFLISPDGLDLDMTIKDDELEEILKGTDELLRPSAAAEESAYEYEDAKPAERSPSASARKIIEENEEREIKKQKKKKRSIIICAAAIAVLALMLAVILLIKSSHEKQEYEQAFEMGQEYYDDGEYDKALEKLRNALGIKKTDECLLLMSQCYEAKEDYVNAIAILESSGSDSSEIAQRIEELEEAKAKYDAEHVVEIDGTEYTLDTESLDLSGRGLDSTDVESIAKLTELKSLDLSDNNITSLSFLSDLENLETLDLSKNEISKISVLGKLSALHTLHLDDNSIKDFTPLYKLSKLKTLTISGMEISKSQLKELKSELSGCTIYSEEAMADVVDITLGGQTFKSDVTALDLSGCGISSIAALAECTELEELDLSGNSISDLTPLLEMTKLKKLDLSDNNISDIRPLINMTELTYLNLDDNSITSIAALSDLTSLTELHLKGSTLKSFSALSSLTSLKTLGLEDTGLSDSDLSALYKLKNLKKLNISDNNVSKSAVDTLQKKLTSCTVTCNSYSDVIVLGGSEFASDSKVVMAHDLGISDISAAAGFTSVKTLDLSGNKISSISALSGLTTLENLDLSYNKISDISALKSLTGLQELTIIGNSISSDQVAQLQQALPECTIIVE